MATEGSFFIGKSETVADEAFNPDALMRQHPEYYGPRFEAISELRAMDDGTLHKGNEFRRVASFVNIPLFEGVKLLDPEFMQNKKAFYAFLRRNRQYATYDIKTHAQNPRYTSTVIDGKVV